MRIVGLVLVLIAVYWGCRHGMGELMDPASALLLLFGAWGVLLFSGTGVANMLKVAFTKRASAEEAQAGARAWKLAGAFFLFGGAIGYSVRLITMLRNLNDPAQIGPGLSHAFIPVFYAVFLTFVICLPLQVHLEKRSQEQPEPAAPAPA